MRNNERRTGAAAAPTPSAPAPSLSFAVPTEFVELPSEGKFYPADHPLHNQKTVEIKYMTAKEEDILSSEALLKNNLVLDRLIESLTVQDIPANSLLLGDRSAILMAARVSGYGNEYKVLHTCKKCFNQTETSFDLKKRAVTKKCFDKKFLKKNKITYDDNTLTFDISLPTSGVEVGLRLITGEKEKDFENLSKSGAVITGFLKGIVAKVNQNTDPDYIEEFIDVIPAKDSKFIRDVYPDLVPKVRMVADFKCGTCYTVDTQEVPLTAEFFWPD